MRRGSPALTIDDPAYFDRLAEVEARALVVARAVAARVATGSTRALRRARSGLRALDVGCGTGVDGPPRLADRPEIAAVVGARPEPRRPWRTPRRRPGPALRARLGAWPCRSRCRRSTS